MIGAAGQLLHRYPPSFAKSEAMRVLRGVGRLPPSRQALRFAVYDILYAFQRLEARRLGLRPDRQTILYAEFRRDFIVALATWVPGKDPFIDGVREALEIAAQHNDPHLDAILKNLIEAEKVRVSSEQRRRAQSSRTPKSIDTYIRDALIKDPKLKLHGLLKKMMDDERGNVIEEFTEDEVYVVGVASPYSRGSIRKRYYDIRKKLKSSR